MDNEHEDRIPEGFVTASTWFAYVDDTLVGIMNLRHSLNDFLLHYGGHIGYSIRVSKRRKGYAKEMLKLTLNECDVRGINPVLITCEQHNEGSRKTILANGGIMENEETFDREIMQRYWIQR